MTGDQPIGPVFAEAAKSAPVQVIGPKDQIIMQGLSDNGVILVTKGKSAEEAWNYGRQDHRQQAGPVTRMTTRHDTAAPPVKEGGAAPGRPPEDGGIDRGGAGSAPGCPGAGSGTCAGARTRSSRPFFLLFVAFGLFPLIYTGWASLHQVELTAPTDMNWVGLRNYTRIFDDEFFWNAAKNTLTIGIISTVPQLLMAMGIAHILNYKLRGLDLLPGRDARAVRDVDRRRLAGVRAALRP